MWPEFFGSDGKQIPLLPVTKKAKLHLPGSNLRMAEKKRFSLRVETFSHSLCSIGFRILRFFQSMRITRKEDCDQLRLEAVLSGELPAVSDKGEAISVKAGEYHFTKHPVITALFKRNSACHYFVTHYSSKLLKELNLAHLAKPSPKRQLTEKMFDVIHRIINNPYEGAIRSLHYDHCIREFLALHLFNEGHQLPAEMDSVFLKAILNADSLLQQDLSVHHSIPDLASRVGLNATYLKSGFKRIFNMGVFERLTYHRLTQAKLLLQTTNRTMDDIAATVGYAGRQSFISAFRKNNNDMTPKKWRRMYWGRSAKV